MPDFVFVMIDLTSPMFWTKCRVLERCPQVGTVFLHGMHGVVENEREEGVKLVGRGVPVATSRVSEHRDAFKLALITADRGEKREFASTTGHVLRGKSNTIGPVLIVQFIVCALCFSSQTANLIIAFTAGGSGWAID